MLTWDDSTSYPSMDSERCVIMNASEHSEFHSGISGERIPERSLQQ